MMKHMKSSIMNVIDHVNQMIDQLYHKYDKKQ